ncbi:DNA-directed RNA polymerase sigma factor [Bacillus sp. JCM 19046]|nr:DNA-directed RNA polymerase sigma factor [Bacillus sp. JCM 19045]GAF18922.1 DNA-directed RNA polymerase sigma factor [Bacillus sp. JCM 19046]
MNAVKQTTDIFLAEHKGIIKAVALRFVRRGESFGYTLDDLINAANEYGLKALELYEPNRGESTTYVYRYVFLRMVQLLNNQNKVLSYPREIKELAYMIQKHGRGESTETLAEWFNKKPHHVRHAQNFNDEKHALDYNGEYEGFPVMNWAPKETDFTSIYVNDFLSTLSEREAQIVKLRLMQWTFAEIGDNIGLSSKRVGNIFRQQIKPKLQDYYAEVEQ